MADPLSITASIAGLVSLANEVGKIIASYIGGVKSAPGEAESLSMELAALGVVLEQTREFLLQEELLHGSYFDDIFVLASLMGFTSSRIRTSTTSFQPSIPPRTGSPELLTVSIGRYAKKNVRRLWKNDVA